MVDYDVRGQLRKLKAQLPADVELVAISKFHPSDYIREAYDEGQRIFGESHEQELKVKHTELPQDIEWHFIGHLQTNKVKYIAPYVSMIHSVDSLKLLGEIERQAARCERTIDVLLELHIAEEATKYGLTPDACRQLLAEGEWRTMTHVRICGVMMMATDTDDQEQIRREMLVARHFFDEVKAQYFADDDAFSRRSWGMSHDYAIAVETGANMVRIGTTIFGPRVY
ncbi:MAG: YggS family pyridoxal phosphate-dependent enzyme [Prevotella sp.]|nr:YggS family pyridoxal phosphate-dependent enzyme [Prevotella sp.]